MCEYFYSSPPPSLLLSLPPIDNILVLKYNLYRPFNSLPPPIDYNKIDQALKSVEGKYLEPLSSPLRAKGQRLFQTTRVLLKRTTLLESELRSNRRGTITIQKDNLNRRKVLSKGGSLYGIVALRKLYAKRIREAENYLRKAQRDLSVAINK